MACGDCIQHSIGSVEFFKTLFPDGRGAQALPISGSFEITLRCNVRCKHCYILYPGATDGEMSTADCKRILDKLSDAGVVFLLLTGGEVFVRPDFKELYLYAKQRGLILSLYSNATLIDEDMAAFLREYPPRKVEVTIYGHTEATYEAVTGVRGSFKRFRRGVELMREYGVPLSLKTILLKTNQHEFEQMRDWVEAMGLQFRYDTNVNPKIDHDPSPLAERLSPQEVVRIEQLGPHAAERVAQIRESIQRVMGQPSRDDLFTCGSGIRTFHVDPRGLLHPCMLWRENPYDLLHRELDENWRRHLHELRGQRNPDGGCTSCSNRGTCMRCPAQSLLERQDPTKNIPYHCEVSQERRRVFGEPISSQFEVV